MTDLDATFTRAGHSDVPLSESQVHTLVALVEDRPGAIDRLVSSLRRRRANPQSLVLGQSEVPGVVRITMVVNDSQVGVDYLVEQLRKLVDVREVVNLATQQAVMRELALIKVGSTPETFTEILQLGDQFGAHAVDVSQGSVTLEVAGSEEKIDRLAHQLQTYGIREIARSGRVVIARDAAEQDNNPNNDK